MAYHLEMKQLLTLVFLSLSSCSAGGLQGVAQTGGDCLYNPAQNGMLRYIGAEEFADPKSSTSIPQYRIEFEAVLDGSPAEHLYQLVTASCKSEFETKKQTSVRIIKLQWGACVPIRINPLELSQECSKQFIGNDF